MKTEKGKFQNFRSGVILMSIMEGMEPDPDPELKFYKSSVKDYKICLYFQFMRESCQQAFILHEMKSFRLAVIFDKRIVLNLRAKTCPV